MRVLVELDVTLDGNIVDNVEQMLADILDRYDEIEENDFSGTTPTGSFDISIPGVTPEAIEVDRRQLHVAALMLMAFDLPAPLDQSARSMLEAARIMPGMTTGDAPMGDRRACLERAIGLIAEMLSEDGTDMVLVPREPTEEMVEAGFKAREHKMTMAESASATYRAMIASKP